MSRHTWKECCARTVISNAISLRPGNPYLAVFVIRSFTFYFPLLCIPGYQMPCHEHGVSSVIVIISHRLSLGKGEGLILGRQAFFLALLQLGRAFLAHIACIVALC